MYFGIAYTCHLAQEAYIKSGGKHGSDFQRFFCLRRERAQPFVDADTNCTGNSELNAVRYTKAVGGANDRIAPKYKAWITAGQTANGPDNPIVRDEAGKLLQDFASRLFVERGNVDCATTRCY